MGHFNIAIDGPAGAGKSTVAREAARRLGMIYVDTGAMYRAIALYFVRTGVDVQDEAAVAAACPRANVTLGMEAGLMHVFLNGEDVTGLIRTEEVGEAASVTSKYLPVREKLTALQKALAARESVIMDGRDIGTCVLTDAPLKIYLTASVDVRTKRRFDELRGRGMPADFDKLKEEITQRDYRDMHRAHAPLKQAPDAIYLDSSALTGEEVVLRVISYAREKGLAI